MSTARISTENSIGAVACCLGMRRWKRQAVTAILATAQLRAVYFGSIKRAIGAARRNNGCVVVWASKSTQALKSACLQSNVKLYHMEDGFLRSRGLGANHVMPVSLVLDGSGIYFDATQTSDLELLLEHAEFTTEEIEQARNLRAQIIKNRLSKYNVGDKSILSPCNVGSNIILVPGQVSDDASLRFGAGAVASNLELLKAVRTDNPKAFIVYKPHPDVEGGKRLGFLAPKVVLRYADFIGSGLSSDSAISMADEVMTMTSLLGFEALIRGKKVTCYGMPFYAGWGLTNDRINCDRRSKERTVDEILAAALLRYARYADPVTGRKISALEAAGLLTPNPR